MADFNLNLSDPISSISNAVIAVSGAVQAELALDLELSRHDPAFRTLLIEERAMRKLFWEPLQAILLKIAQSITVDEE